jgi:subtilisin family serine protease
MKVKLIIISIILLLVMVFACGCIPVMEKLGLVNPTNEEQLSPEKGGPPDGLVKVLIGFKEKPGPPQQALVKGLGGKIKYTYNLIPAIAASVPEKAIEALKKNPNITNVELDNQVFALGQTLPWGIDRIDAEVVHTNSDNRGAGVNIAIIDSGIDYSHPDLNDNYAGGYDFVNGDTDPMDDDGHGTHVAGIVAALDNNIGVVGVAPNASLHALKVLNEEGVGYMSDVVLAIQWATVNEIQVINMSLGGNKNIFLEWACNLAYYDDGLLLLRRE